MLLNIIKSIGKQIEFPRGADRWRSLPIWHIDMLEFGALGGGVLEKLHAE